MTEPKFTRGDLVRHRASGELAVVVAPNQRCVSHDEATAEGRAAHLFGRRPECTLEFSGSYDLDLGFREDVITVEEYLLEPVDPEPEGEATPCE